MGKLSRRRRARLSREWKISGLIFTIRAPSHRPCADASAKRYANSLLIRPALLIGSSGSRFLGQGIKCGTRTAWIAIDSLIQIDSVVSLTSGDATAWIFIITLYTHTFQGKVGNMSVCLSLRASKNFPLPLLSPLITSSPSILRVIDPKYLPQYFNAPKRALCSQQRRRGLIPRARLAHART